jgi:DNA-binding MarR family transcriptional regulator
VSRQAISVTSRDLEKLGYLSRERDPHDARGLVLRLTEHGVRLIEDSVAAVASLERSFARPLGSRQLEDLRRTAYELYHALRLEQEIFESRPPNAVASDSRARQRDDEEIRRLALRLRHQLGDLDAERLAARLAADSAPGTREREMMR